MPRLIPSREAMDDFLVLLKRYSAQCRKCFESDSVRGQGIRGNPYTGLSALRRKIDERLATDEFLASFGWPKAIEQALEFLQSGELFYHISRFLIPIPLGGPGKGQLLPFDRRKAEETWPDDSSKWIRAITGFDFDRRNAETTLAELEMLIEDLATAVSATGGPLGEWATRAKWEADCQIIETLRAVAHQCTTMALLGEMNDRGLNPSDSTVKKRLAEMAKHGRLTKDPKARPPGYGLPEWK